MMTTANLHRTPNRNIVSQHLEEAAFYWLRRQNGLWHPAYKEEHVRRFDTLLDAHLEGLRTAGMAALPGALASFEKWKTPDEAFVTTYLLASTQDPHGQERAEALLLAHPESHPGAAAALMWSSPAVAQRMAKRWIQHPEGSMRRIALPALIRTAGDSLEAVRSKACQDPDPGVRARGFRNLGEGLCVHHAATLQNGLKDEAVEGRFEAICALALLGQPMFTEQLPGLFDRLPPSALRRALLFWAACSDAQPFAAWVQQPDLSPEQDRQRLWAIAFRGDPLWLDYLIERLSRKETARLSAYALGHMTGVDLDLEGLDRQAAEEGEPETADEDPDPVQAGPDEDLGLLEPDPEAVKNWIHRNATRFPRGRPYLGGSPLDDGNAQEMATGGWQPQRWQAACFLALRGQGEALRQMRNPTVRKHGAGNSMIRRAPPIREADWKEIMLAQAKAADPPPGSRD